MASSSTSFVHKSRFKYDVFLSFRGEDTRANFVDHLYDSLKRENIETYKDDKNLEKGKKLSKELIQAIQDSRFHVVVFSKNYASSSWCLDELVMIMECQKRQIEHTVYPIFYDVEPTEVRKQSGAFGEAFAKCKKGEYEGKWRKALEDASSFSGWDLRTIANGQVEFIKIVVNEISLKLPSISADDNLVGMRTRINGVVSSLNTFPDQFCMIGIWGMGGIGKTTLARAVFDQICNQFEGSSFVENVRESSSSLVLGLKSLQQQVLTDVLNKQNIKVTGVLDGKKMMKKYMPGRKVLVVLDDVDNIEQLKALAGEPNWFMKGSKIIITTRDKQVLLAHKVNLIHDVSLLTDEEAICLLSRCAFGTDIPMSGYKEVSRKVVSYAAGLPLTITILGSSLFKANEHVWIDTLEKLKEIPLHETLQKLELSYMGLDTECKEIFLDVACILKGWKEAEAIRVLESRGFHAICGLDILKKKSLIFISHDEKLGMHDHIEEMGRHVVRCLHPDDPKQHSRLWIKKEIVDVLAINQGTEATKCIKFFSTLSSDIKPETIMKGLGNMGKLRFLFVKTFEFRRPELDEASQLPNSLQYLEWYRYPFRFLPKSFQASNLVVLKMSNSRIEQLWEGGERKVLDKLQFLELVASKLRTLDLGLTPNLETLDLQRCYDLAELDIHVGCQRLKSLKLSELKKLSTLDLLLTPNIETLNLDQCVGLVELSIPRKCSQLKTLNLEGCSGLVKLDMPRECPKLITLNLERCSGLVKLDIPCEWPQLQTLNPEGCSGLKKLDMPCEWAQLQTLNLAGCSGLEKLYMPCECPKLITLNLEGCSGLVKLDMPCEWPQLQTLNLNGCKDLEELYMPHKYPQLKTLRMSCPKLRSFNVNDLVLPKLEYLTLIHSKSRTLELTLNLRYLTLRSSDLVAIHIPEGDVKLESVDISRCSKLETLDLKRTPNLKYLHIASCNNLLKLLAPVGGLEKLIHLTYFSLNGLKIRGVNEIPGVLDMSEMSVDISQLQRNNNFPW